MWSAVSKTILFDCDLVKIKVLLLLLNLAKGGNSATYINMISLQSSLSRLLHNKNVFNSAEIHCQVVKCLSTSSALLKSSSSSKSYPPNSSLEIKNVYNRNPRNLEKLRIGDKPVGWNIDNPGKSYWNKIILEISSKHVSAEVKHFTGAVAVRASTTEWCIRKHLYSTKDAVSIKTIAEVIAQRCLQAGISEVAVSFTKEQLEKEKIQSFMKALTDGGLTLEEPEQLPRLEISDLQYPKIHEKHWEVYEELEEKVFPMLEQKYTKSSAS